MRPAGVRLFPPLTLHDVAARPIDLSASWADGPALILVGHCDCQTTRQALPHLDRIHRRRARGACVLAVLQDEPETVHALTSQLGLTLPIALEPDPYPLARALSLEVVPALFLVQPGGAIAALSEGFRRADLEGFAERLGVEGALFSVDEIVPVFRPG